VYAILDISREEEDHSVKSVIKVTMKLASVFYSASWICLAIYIYPLSRSHYCIV
jgi:hypothetical protein